MTARTSYKTVQISLIPVERRAEGYFSIALWTRDLNASVEQMAGVRILCPVRDVGQPGLQPIDPRVRITDAAGLDDAALRRIVAEADVVEVSGNFGWRDTTLSRRLMREARRQGKPCLVGVSSNRARTTLMNARDKGWPRRLRAWLKAWDIRLTQRYMLRRCDGVRVVGQGLVPLVEPYTRSVHVDIASWISAQDFDIERPAEAVPVRVVMAARLERMKGMHIGVRAVARTAGTGLPVALRIIGEGPEEAALRALVAEQGLSDVTQFTGQLAYPEPFFDAMRQADVVFLTNLNDEQPRLIFDAISRGAIPLCPRTPPYQALGLDARLLYTQGDEADLHRTLVALVALGEAERNALRAELAELAGKYTIERMHAKRRAWVLSLLNGPGQAG